MEESLQELESFIGDLNAELFMACKSRDGDVVKRRILARLEKKSWVGCFDIQLDPIEVPGASGALQSWHCTLTLKPDVWERRHRYNGFLLFVCHPELTQSGAEIAAAYRRRDLVEKDFQTIKGEIKLRPIYHYKDSKVSAHVTLCMLALLLERVLQSKLRAANQSITAKSCFELLQTCHLNRHRGAEGQSLYYTLTVPTDEQRRILSALGLDRLVSEEAVQRATTPRLIAT